MEKRCPECNSEIIGRIDKKFCSDYCRNAYNNKIRKDSNNSIRKINNILRKNRRILEDFVNEDGKGKASKEQLYKKGFDFTYHTNTLTTKTGNHYIFCYDYGYLELKQNWFAIVKRN